ncbi:hypothetical protein cypCar_00038362 [Cyprinus carpio]|nr:hypothetical protein cypCar_00038362 [Cyprinus carpio]
MKIHGHSGETVTIVCSYSWASTNIKYFCRDPCKDSKDILVKSDQSPTGRYTLKDSGEGTFTVNITDLQESDSGIYWCGVERSVKDTYQKVNLTVSNDSDTNTNRPTTPKPAAGSQSSTAKSSFSTSSASGDITASSSSTGPLMFTAVGLTVIFIIFGAVLCIWNNQKKKSHSSKVDAEIQGTTHTTESPTGRYTLKDSGEGTFTVKITDLQESDSGIYWCGVDRSLKDTYQKVILTVSKDPSESITTSTQPYKDIQTSTDSHTITPAAHSESPSVTASKTTRYPSPDDITLSPSITGLTGFTLPNQSKDDQDDGVYENNPPKTKSTQMKPINMTMTRQVQKSQEYAVYENSHELYGNL